MLDVLALIAAAASALLLYLASPHCRIVVRATARRSLRVPALLCAVIACAAAVAAFGTAAGLCIVLGAWMLCAVALPFLALVRRAPAERA